MKIDRIENSGLVVLFVGVALLAFTFFSAFGFLIGKLNIVSSSDLVQFFGAALAPIVEATIRILYLAIMGWISSILTIRGVQLLKKEAVPTPITQEVKTETKSEAKQQLKPEAEKKPRVKDVKEPKTTQEPDESLETETPTQIVVQTAPAE